MKKTSKKVEKEIYCEVLECINCQEREVFKIPMGETINNFSTYEKCPNCGCINVLKTVH